MNPKNNDPCYLQGVRDHHHGDDDIGSMHDDSGDVLTFVAAAAYTSGLASAGIAAVAAMVDEAAAGAALAAAKLVQWVGNLLKRPALPGKITANTERADAERRAVQQKLVDLLHKIELGTDPATKAFRAGEAETGSLLESYLGRTLSRHPTGAADWIDRAGRTYDAVGPIPSKHFNFQEVSRQIFQHLTTKGADYVPIDLSGLTTAQTARIRDYVSGLPSSLANKVILLWR